MNKMPKKRKQNYPEDEVESTVQGLWRAGAPLKTVGVHVDAERLGEAVHWHVGGAR